MTDEYIENYSKYIDKWGLEAQLQITLEEMSELSKEICKYIRYSTFEKQNNGKIEETKQNLRSELADVLNMAEQLEYYFGVDEIEKIRREKILRTDKLLENED